MSQSLIGDKSYKEVQLLNIADISVTLEVSQLAKKDMSTNELHPSNIEDMSFTLSVTPYGTIALRDFKPAYLYDKSVQSDKWPQ